MKECTIQPGSDVIVTITGLMQCIAVALVDDAESVSVVAADEGDGTVLQLRVAPADLGKVIGKQGRTARSIRTILSAASMKAHHRFALDIQQAMDSGEGLLGVGI